MEWLTICTVLVIAFSCGVLAGWSWVRARGERALGDAERRAAGASAEANSLRAELDSRKLEIAGLQRSLRDAEAAKAALQARIEETQRGLEQQRVES